MPKPTFFRLPDDKRERLIKAAYAEFTRAPFPSASISNIIKGAGIPRGSFYQYFDDKADIFFYLLSRLRDETITLTKTSFTAAHGDFFVAMGTIFDHAIDAIVTGPYRKFYANLFMYMDFHSAAKLGPGSQNLPPHHPKPKGEMMDYILTHVDRQKLRITADTDVRLLIRQVIALFIQTVSHYYNRRAAGAEMPVAELKRRVQQTLDWLHYGVGRA